MGQRKRRKFTPEYKSEVVKLVRTSGKSIGQVSKETAVRAWVKRAEIDERKDPHGPLTSEERGEVTRLRRELRTVTTQKWPCAFILMSGCAAAPPPVLRDPSGPCLQLVLRRIQHSEQGTLWRGDQMAWNGWTGTHGMDAPLVQATADSPAAAREAQAFRRARIANRALVWSIAGAFAAFVTMAALAAHDQHLERASIGVDFLFPVWGLVAIAGGSILDQVVAPPHLDRAIASYNAARPAGCTDGGDDR
jgi:transposase